MRVCSHGISWMRAVDQPYMLQPDSFAVWVISGIRSAVTRRVAYMVVGDPPTTMGERWLASGIPPRANHAHATSAVLYHVAFGFSTNVF